MSFVRLALAALCLITFAPSARAKKPAKVVVIGIDGVSLNLLEPFIKEGVTPNLGAIADGGARGNLQSIWPLRTPQVWTSAVTGKLPGQHGIWDHLSNTYFNPPEFRTKEKKRITREARRSKALWNILGEKSIRSLAVGWMATWPAEEFPGVMAAPVELMGDKRQTSIKGSFYDGADKMFAPQSIEKKGRKFVVDPTTIKDADLKAFADVPPEGSPLYDLPYFKRYVYGLRWSLARAQSVEALTVGLYDDAKADVVFSYFQCPDSLLHRFWIFQKSPDEIRERLVGHGLDGSHADELHRRFKNVVRACYEDVDQRVGRILKAVAGPDTLVLVVSDHGFGNAPVPHKMKDEPYSGDHLDEGVILAKGPGIRAGTRIDGASILDITPSLLHFFGLPTADDMRGTVRSEIIGGAKGAVKRIPTYEAAPQNEAPYAEGWPPRKKAFRSVAGEMAGAR